MAKPPLIYNLFPRLVGHLDEWLAHTARAAALGFDWVFINPVQYSGFSGSLYAIKDFYRLNPLFIPPETDDAMEALGRTVEAIHGQGLKVMMDLVVNHTSKDCPLIKAHPAWYRRDRDGYVVSPSAIDPADARKVTVWGDLAEVDNAKSSERQSLWAYWTAMVQYYLELGFDGFRCDAAYKVPSALWEQLINAVRLRKPDALFLAETLGCRLAEARTLRDCGFDYLCNSSKWWCFDQAWAIDQHAEFGAVAPSVGFPESHDTERLMSDTGGLVAVQKQRYSFAAAFSEGLLMPVGYEFGFRRKLDVGSTRPEDWEDTEHDLGPFISAVNRLKVDHPLLSCEGHWEALTPFDRSTIVLCKREAIGSEAPAAVLLVNKDWHQPRTLEPSDLAACRAAGEAPSMVRVCRPAAKPIKLPDRPFSLDPAEVVYILP